MNADDSSWRSDPWLGVNPTDPAFRADPYPFLKRLREHDPVNETPIGGLLKRFPTLELQLEELVWGRSLFRVLGELPIRCRR